MMFCINCNKSYEKDTLFCGDCGKQTASLNARGATVREHDTHLIKGSEQHSRPVPLEVQSGMISALRIESTDTLDDILKMLSKQTRPTILIVPEHGEAFSRREHFTRLRHLNDEIDILQVLGFVIPSQRSEIAEIAYQHGFSVAPSLEEAVSVFVHSSQPSFYPSLSMLPNIDSQKRQQGKGSKDSSTRSTSTWATPLGKNVMGAASRFRPGRPRFLPAGLVAAFLLVSALLLVPLFFSLHQPRVSSRSGTAPLGSLSFSSSEQYDRKSSRGLNDMLSLNLHSLAAPKAGNAYYAWLLPDLPNDETFLPLLLGKLSINAGGAQLHYNHPQHTNLLANFSKVKITEQPDGNIPTFPSLDPKLWRYSGAIPNTPTPGDEKKYSLLSHLRHLLAGDPTLDSIGLAGGLEVWLSRNTDKINEWASAAHDEHSTALIHRHIVRIVEYLDGQAYFQGDVPQGTSWSVDSLEGRLGLLDIVPDQNPAGYLTHVDTHLRGLTGAPGHTAEQRQLAVQIDAAINTIKTQMQQIRQDTVQLVKMNETQLGQQDALSKLNEITSLAKQAQGGQFDRDTNGITGGVIWIDHQIQRLADIPVGVSTDESA
jgi:hypothetical protein